jgi:multiphosphoryl transfer protein
MLSILLVSHSKKLAESVAEMAMQMVATNSVRISIAAGIGEDNRELGTNAVEIADAIMDLISDEGVLILMDIGSAVLSTQMAIQLIPPELNEKARICPAPFIEGAVAAAAQASTGSDLDTVYREAVNSIQSKEAQIEEKNQDHQKELKNELSINGEEKKKEIILQINNEHGLHARPGVKFVQIASSFDAEIMVKNLTTGKGPSSAKSLTAVTLLGVSKGHQVQITAQGKQRDEALQALADLIESRFGEQ